ncbi:hypothetical protein D3C76_1423180 [compost metagenome]
MYADQLRAGDPYFTSLFENAPWFFGVLYVLNVLVFPLALYMEQAPKKIWKSLILFPVFLVSWYPVTFYAFFTQNNKQWSHTQHTRVLRLEEVQSKQAS